MTFERDLNKMGRGFFAFGAVFLACSCADVSDPTEEPEGTDLKPAAPVNAVDAPAFPEHALVGTMRKVVNGQVKWTKALDASPKLPANVGELLESGKPDSDGFVYRDVDAARSDDGITIYHLHYVVRQPMTFATAEELAAKPKGNRAPLKPTQKVKLNDAAIEAIADKSEDEYLEVYIRLAKPFSTQLHATKQISVASLASAEIQLKEKTARISARKAEASALQASVSDKLAELGAVDVGGFWTSNGLNAKVPIGRLKELSEHPEVARISYVPSANGDMASEWDGYDIKSSAGLNAGVYHDNGYTGQAYSNTAGGRMMRIGFIGQGFPLDHPGFRDCASLSCINRAYGYDCTTDPCTPNAAQTPTDDHPVACAGLGAGSIRQGQIAGYTDQQELERSGVAEEAKVYLFSIGSTNFVPAVKRSLEKAIELGIDVFSSSTGWGSFCDPDVGYDLEQTVYDATAANMLVVVAAGNYGSSACTTRSLANAPAAFAVGSVEPDGVNCTDATYSTCGISSFSSRGGLDAKVDTVNHTAALSLVTAVTDGCVKYMFGMNGGVVAGECGTSYAAPQVAGAALLFKDWALTNGHSTMLITGRPFAAMQSMTDRFNGTTYKTAGFNSLWGGGRMQMRMFDSSDLSAPWMWESYGPVLSDGQTDQHPVYSTANEPAGIGQFKSNMVFFEHDVNDIADIDLQVFDKNCGSGANLLREDPLYDVKSMVRLSGVEASGKALCTKLVALHVPSGTTRRAHVINFYSGDTSMR